MFKFIWFDNDSIFYSLQIYSNSLHEEQETCNTQNSRFLTIFPRFSLKKSAPSRIEFLPGSFMESIPIFTHFFFSSFLFASLGFPLPNATKDRSRNGPSFGWPPKRRAFFATRTSRRNEPQRRPIHVTLDSFNDSPLIADRHPFERFQRLPQEKETRSRSS